MIEFKQGRMLLSREDAMILTGLDDPRLRNYELESKLHREDRECVINEPCPFNGRFCRWGQL